LKDKKAISQEVLDDGINYLGEYSSAGFLKHLMEMWKKVNMK